MNAPNIGNIITNPTIRKYVYITYASIAFILGAIAAGYNAIELTLPEWHTIAVAVTGFVGAGVGGLAIANTPVKEEENTPEAIAKQIQK